MSHIFVTNHKEVQSLKVIENFASLDKLFVIIAKTHASHELSSKKADKSTPSIH